MLLWLQLKDLCLILEVCQPVWKHHNLYFTEQTKPGIHGMLENYSFRTLGRGREYFYCILTCKT